MDTKVLLTGIISFVAGALLVAVAATSLEKPTGTHGGEQSMVDALKDKTGDDFDRAFLAGMIMHHQDAIAMANMAEAQASHAELKALSKAIVETQQKEINTMKQWQVNWGFGTNKTVNHR